MTKTKTKKKQIAPQTKKARVLLVDDHPVLREGLARVVEQEIGLVVCGQAATAQHALKTIEATKPDIALVDISLEDSNGIELIKDIKVRWPKLPVLVLSMHDESVYAERSLRAGARGYLMKREPSQKLLEAIQLVLQGEIYLSETMTRKMLHTVARGAGNRLASPMDLLSDRELEVFELLGEGTGLGAIAKKLHLSAKTVEYHREHIKQKLEIKSAPELLRYAIQWMQSNQK